MPKHTRSREGCRACKEKRIKCDETRPWCRNCQGRDIQCPGYARQIRWKMTFVSLDAVRERPPKTLAVQPSPWSPLDGFAQAPAERLSADPSSSQLMIVDESWGPHLNMQASQRDMNYSQFSYDQVLLHALLATETNSQMSTLDQDSISTEKSEQNHDGAIALTPSPMESRASEHVSPQISTVCDDYLYQTEIVPSMSGLTDESCSYTVGSSACALSGDVLSSRKASAEEARYSQEDECQTLVLDTMNATIGPPADDAWPSSTEKQFAEKSHFDMHAAATEVGQQGVECGSLSLSSSVWQNNTWMKVGTENILTAHYFDHICQIMSCFDSRQNPFRKYIPRVMLTCEYINDCINSLSAAHLANSIQGMDNIALSHQTKAIQGLMSVLQTMQQPIHPKGSDDNLSRFSITVSRQQALLTALLLGISTAWYDASATGRAHHQGARLLFQAWLIDQGLHDTSKESVVLDYEQSFIIGAMIYLECLVSLIVDQPTESLNYLLNFATFNQGRRWYPNPWTGISTPLFAYLAGSATLIRRRLYLMSKGDQRSDTDLEIIRSARELYGLVLAHRPPSETLVDDTQDANTPLAHLFAMDAILRLVILLELTIMFPEVMHDSHMREMRQSRLELAIAVLTIVFELPQSSGANVMLTIPLLSAGSALQPIQSVPRNMYQDYNLGSTCFDELRSQITALILRPSAVQTWRGRVARHIEQLHHRVGLAPLKRMNAILESVWRRADKANHSGTSLSDPMVHWMNVMTEEGLETLLG